MQYFTIFHGPERNLTHQRLRVEHLGRVPRPYTAEEIRANRFQLTLRDLEGAELPRIKEGLEEVASQGVPNYFDDQRFGSVSDGRFVAKAMILGRFDEALQLALTAPYEHDRSQAKREKAILKKHWGNWQAAQDQLPRGHARSFVGYLVHHPSDFRGALERLRPELRSLYLSAYQSFLWNQLLSGWLVMTPPAP